MDERTPSASGPFRTAANPARPESAAALSPVRRGFPNLASVRRALKTLVLAIEGGELPAPSRHLFDGWEDYRPNDAVVSAQWLARAILDVYGIAAATVIVSFHDGLEVAGRIELGGVHQTEYFVEVRGELRSEPRKIAATLAHEVAHIFLRRHELETSNVLETEILTDTTAALYGFGALMADTYEVDYQRRFNDTDMSIVRSENSMGYLTPDELGYVLTHAGVAHADEHLESDAAKAAMELGRERALRELHTPPLRSAGLLARLDYLVQRWLARWLRRENPLTVDRDFVFSGDKVSFRCTHCTQPLRLPLFKRLEATCPRCRHVMTCAT